MLKNPDKILKRINILVVDDMEAITSMVKACLKSLGAEHIFTCYNGESAWTRIEASRIDLIVCDWDMPKMSGIELLEKVRTNDCTKHIPFLMLTASIDKPRVIKAMELGVNDYLSKPFRPKDLEFRIIKLLAKVKLPAKNNSN